MSQPIKLITFDLDDTLWDVRPALEQAEAAQWASLRARYPKLDITAVDPADLQMIRQQLLAEHPGLMHRISQFREQFIVRLLRHLGISELEAIPAAADAFMAFISERHKVSVYQEAAPLLSQLRQSYVLGAITNGNADVFKTPIGHFFHHAWRAEDLGVSKPDPALFRHAFAEAGVFPEEVVHVGDCLENDVQGAINAGATPIWFNPNNEQCPNHTASISCLSELPAAVASLTG